MEEDFTPFEKQCLSKPITDPSLYWKEYFEATRARELIRVTRGVESEMYQRLNNKVIDLIDDNNNSTYVVDPSRSFLIEQNIWN